MSHRMFRGSITIATVAGIPVRLHWTFAVLLGWFFVDGAAHGGTIAAGLASAAFSVGVFACVVLHELGHALAARRYGIRTRDITLFALGGVATLERMPDRPSQGIVVALAGPVVNIVIAAALFAGLVWQEGLEAMVAIDAPGARIQHGVASLAAVNVWLVLFNLLPAFPMDGGRVLREALAAGMGPVRATRVAAGIGQALAVVMAIVGLLGSPLLVLIALHVWIAAAAEVAETEATAALAGLPVSAAMARRFDALSPTHTLGQAAQRAIEGSQRDFPVTAGGGSADQVVGMLTGDDLARTLARFGAAASVVDAMRREFPLVRETDPLEKAIASMRSMRCSAAPVLRDGRLVGLVTAEGIGDLVAIRSAESRVRTT